MTERIKFINMKEFAAQVLDVNNETFLMHVVALDLKDTNMAIYSSRAAQIRLLKTNKAPTTIPT